MNIIECLAVVDAWIASNKKAYEGVGVMHDEYSAAARAMAAAVLHESHKVARPAWIAVIKIPPNSARRSVIVLCPFHTEKTPSCAVDVVKQTFHCFSCGAKGSAVSVENGNWELRNEN